jgi:membrane protease YdiL (CAAX protease family)
VQQGIFLTVSLVVARFEEVPLFPPSLPPWSSWLAGLLLFGASWMAMRPLWRAAVARGEPQARLAMPTNSRERWMWAGVSLAAGIGEEISYRGVMFGLLTRLTGEPLLATAGMAALFGAAHVVQGWRGIAVTTGYAVAAQGLVMWSGSLYVAMAWHVAYDLVAGLSYGRYGRALGPAAGGSGPPAAGTVSTA